MDLEITTSCRMLFVIFSSKLACIVLLLFLYFQLNGKIKSELKSAHFKVVYFITKQKGKAQFASD